MTYRFTPRHGDSRDISLTFMSGPQDGETRTFRQPAPGEERVLSIGRREGSEIHLSYDGQVSRLHARLLCSNHQIDPQHSNQHVMQFFLQDMGSRNGSFIEKQSEPIPSDQPVSLRPGSLFRIGRTWLRLDLPLSMNDSELDEL
jgi:pSer/pThr/pTyr-binding forkhead associated (FHA) protein